MATQLSSLRIEEISGVDAPANELPGWIVRKRKDGTVDEDATKAELEKLEKNYAMLYSCLVAGLEYFDGADDDTKDAVNKVVGFLERVLTGEESDEKSEKREKDESENESLETLGQKILKLLSFGRAPEPEPEEKDEPEAKPEVDAEKDGEEEGPEDAEKDEAKPEVDAEKDGDGAAKDEDTAEAVKVLAAVAEKLLERLELVEQRQTGKQSLDGQEETVKGNGKPTLTDAIRSAARGQRVTIR